MIKVNTEEDDYKYAIISQQLTRKFGDFTAVDRLNLKIPKGTIYGFLGPNGCGKSTTLRVLTGLLSPTSGSVKVLGLEIPKQVEKLRLRIGYMTQRFSLYDELSVYENLQFMGQIYSIPNKKLTLRIKEQMLTYGLSPLAKKRADCLSGGQRQRLGLAAATIHQPDMLFLDEPTSAVDPENRRDFWEQLFDLCDKGTTILITTHYMDEAERCHGLAIMADGVIRVNGTPEYLMQNMGVTVVEILANDLRQLKRNLILFQEIRSASQLGVRLRVLIDKGVMDPIEWLRTHNPSLKHAELRVVRPSLEDVFVTSTGKSCR